ALGRGRHLCQARGDVRPPPRTRANVPPPVPRLPGVRRRRDAGVRPAAGKPAAAGVEATPPGAGVARPGVRPPRRAALLPREDRRKRRRLGATVRGGVGGRRHRRGGQVMILAALKELAEREGLVANPHLEEKAVAYFILVGQGGKYLGVRGAGQGDS